MIFLNFFTMEEHISSKSEKDNKINKQLIKKYKSFEPDIKNQDLKEKSETIRYQSCKTITNFVPKILPKKSFLKPSLFVLNPDDIFPKKLSQNQMEHNLLVLDNSDSDSDDNSSDLESSDENFDEKNTDNTDKDIIEKDVNNTKNKSNEELMDNNSKQEFESFNDNNNKVINNGSNSDANNGNNYLSIFDVLSKNYK